MSSIWSASSRTTILTLSSRMACRSIRSINRPGVAITTWQPAPRLALAGGTLIRHRPRPRHARGGRRRACQTPSRFDGPARELAPGSALAAGGRARRQLRGSERGTRPSSPFRWGRVAQAIAAGDGMLDQAGLDRTRHRESHASQRGERALAETHVAKSALNCCLVFLFLRHRRLQTQTP